jgi:hypothetical protein
LVLPVAINAIDDEKKKEGSVDSGGNRLGPLIKETGISDLPLRATFRELVTPEKYERKTFE